MPVSLAAQGEKAVNLRLRFLPTFLSGAIVGVNAMYEDVPAGSVAGTGGAVSSVGSPDHLQETDLGVHLVVMHGGIHFILEGAYIRHYDFRTGGVSSRTTEASSRSATRSGTSRNTRDTRDFSSTARETPSSRAARSFSPASGC